MLGRIRATDAPVSRGRDYRSSVVESGPLAAPLGRVVEEGLLGDLVAAPGLPGDLLLAHSASVLEHEAEAPTHRHVVPVDQRAAKQLSFDTLGPGQHAGLLLH